MAEKALRKQPLFSSPEEVTRIAQGLEHVELPLARLGALGRGEKSREKQTVVEQSGMQVAQGPAVQNQQIQGTHSWAVGDRGHLCAPCRTELFAQGGHHDPGSSPLGWPDLQLDGGSQRREVSHSKPQILLSAAPGFSLPSRLSLNTTA